MSIAVTRFLPLGGVDETVLCRLTLPGWLHYTEGRRSAVRYCPSWALDWEYRVLLYCPVL